MLHSCNCTVLNLSICLVLSAKHAMETKNLSKRKVNVGSRQQNTTGWQSDSFTRLQNHCYIIWHACLSRRKWTLVHLRQLAGGTCSPVWLDGSSDHSRRCLQFTGLALIDQKAAKGSPNRILPISILFKCCSSKEFPLMVNGEAQDSTQITVAAALAEHVVSSSLNPWALYWSRINCCKNILTA